MDDRKDRKEKLLLGRPITRRRILQGSLISGAAVAGASLLPAMPRQAWADTPKKGGNLRVAILGGSNADTLDAHSEVTQPDSARVMSLYEGLVRIDPAGKLINVLAESMEANATATEWTIRLRKGVEFHNGKPLTAEDVTFTLRRIADPKAPMTGATALKQLDLAGIKILDDVTLKVPMKAPYAAFPEGISAVYFFGIVPTGYDPKKPVGTGPFKFESFTPGSQSVFSRFDNYWQPGKPYLDKLTIIDSFAGDTAAFNALQGGQVDVFAYAPLSLIAQVGQGSPLKALVSKPGQWTPFTMRVDQAPFDNPDVRMAFRLLVDRQQMINLSLSGYGQVANDVFSPWDPCFDPTLKRGRDLDQAKFLLKKAGQENLSVELVTSDFAAGVVQAAQVFAQQAQAAGVTVKVRQVTADVFYGDQYLKWPFAQDYWAYSPYLSQVAQGSLPTAPFNETHWNNEQYNKLYDQAQATVDLAKRCEIVQAMQKLDFEQGGYIIASYNQSVDLMASNVQGFVPAATGIALGNFGFADAWLA
jgi:peptide/nickel transport system substrate-binding protein